MVSGPELRLRSHPPLSPAAPLPATLNNYGLEFTVVPGAEAPRIVDAAPR
jgi:hypothetical protein